MKRLFQFLALMIVSASLSSCDAMRRHEVQSEKRRYQRMSERIGMSTTEQ